MFGKSKDERTDVEKLQDALNRYGRTDETRIERNARREWEEKYPDLVDDVP